MTRVVAIALSVGAAIVVAAILLFARVPAAPEPVQVARAKGDLQIRNDISHLEFADRFAMAPPSPAIVPTEVRTVRVPTGPALLPTHQQAAPRDVCAAHGLRRYYYKRNGWTYWRCGGR